MIVYGASGHAKVIFDIAKSIGESVDFVLDDDRSIRKILDYSVNHEWSEEMFGKETVIAIGNNAIRKRIAAKISNDFCEALIHNSAVLSEKVVIGNGSAVMANAIINSSTEIGRHCIINSGSVIEHDVVIKDFVHISPSATITGNVRIGEGTHIGAGATIIPGLNIGKWATIGAGAVIISDIPDFSVVVGNPGKIIKFNKIQDE